MRFLYDFVEKRWLRGEEALKHAENSVMRNKKWFEVFIIGEKQIRNIIKNNTPAQELLDILQTAQEEILLPESMEEELANWRERIQSADASLVRPED